MARRHGHGHLLLLLLLGLGGANAESPRAALAPDAGPVSDPALPAGIECPVRPGDPRHVNVAWEQAPSGVRSLVISPTGRVLTSSWWKAPPSFVCRSPSIDVGLSPGWAIPLAIEEGGERVVPDAGPLRALLDALWKERPGSALDRARVAQDMLTVYANLLGKYEPALAQEVQDLHLREQLWSGTDERTRRWGEIAQEFSSTPRGRKLLEEYSERLRQSAEIPFLLRLEKELGVSYYAGMSDDHPLLYWQGVSFCVAQVGKAPCEPEGPCKGRDVVRCYDTGAKRWGPKRARGVTPSRAPDAPTAGSLRGQRYTVSGCSLSREGAPHSIEVAALLRPVPEGEKDVLSCSPPDDGRSPQDLLFSDDGRFAVLVVHDRKLLGYDCPPGRISCGGFEQWDDKYPLRLYSVVFDP